MEAIFFLVLMAIGSMLENKKETDKKAEELRKMEEKSPFNSKSKNNKKSEKNIWDRLKEEREKLLKEEIEEIPVEKKGAVGHWETLMDKDSEDVREIQADRTAGQAWGEKREKRYEAWKEREKRYIKQREFMADGMVMEDTEELDDQTIANMRPRRTGNLKLFPVDIKALREEEDMELFRNISNKDMLKEDILRGIIFSEILGEPKSRQRR